MSNAIFTIASAMFGIPLVLLLVLAIVWEIPSPILFVGGWSMAFGVIVAGLGAVIAWYGG
jgi:hypothetical protein